ncbi:hypothetical protein [Planktothrix agardhii]|jgi:hypothetical protein|uniref:vWA-MoxR associated protein N-terminal HTH domain-containing protein n=1 Tax=Planktothrix agardhii (strain NIVA-CYA 126/8) TaxID=388467 RepID=A0A073CKD1_PLAA1|nr:hypothetical protein [Planktothrix agardhii]BBD55786.1 hypothetical protein NIES204_31030 [Planktothrix agardhii NIES-204]KEI68347.1 hypothetical protein A19Y_3592 [Planktothrix agardhii NIVA-CYA 126/8]MCB8758807.1 hypothetical protein [Planktothrix agardhii 1813]MCB8765450.1 hypothetical protein [Planktothrix agardhii 1809]MCB8779086.1 hypothetical protein [Planktothrix agardhii 1031]
MTVDEALTITEMVLDDRGLNKVQEIVFRHVWEGKSYREISTLIEYDYEYIKDVGSKLWKRLSEAFWEKVKKDNLNSVVRRYLKREEVNLSQNRYRLIEINLSGAELNGASLSIGNLSETPLLITNLNKFYSRSSDSSLDLVSESEVTELEDLCSDLEHHQQIFHNGDNKIYCWKGLQFSSEAEVKIAVALDQTGVIFLPKSKVRLTTQEGRENQETDFLICDRGKWGILNIEDLKLDNDRKNWNEHLTHIDNYHSISVVKYYSSEQCIKEANKVVQEFLEILNQT